MKSTKKTLAIFGGTSAVAHAYGRLQAEQGRGILLIGRNQTKLKANAKDLEARGAAKATVHICDLGDTGIIEAEWKKIKKKAGIIDEALIAYGVLGDQIENQTDVTKLRTIIDTNFTSVAMWSELVFDHMVFEGKGQLSIIGSVAGDRGRMSNYHYGSTKGALELISDGMAHRAAHLKEAKINVTLIKPGFIDSPMTDGIDKGGPLWASPEKIAKIINKAVARRKTKVYAPWFWRLILLAICYTPNFVFHRTKL